MNHTTIGIAAILAVVMSTAGAFAVSTAYAGGGGGGDSVKIKKEIKNHCWAVDSEDFSQCNQTFNRNVNQGNATSISCDGLPPGICRQILLGIDLR